MTRFQILGNHLGESPSDVFAGSVALSSGRVEDRLKLCGGAHHFIGGRRGAKEHRAEHFLVVGVPVRDVSGGWRESEGAWLAGAVVRP